MPRVRFDGTSASNSSSPVDMSDSRLIKGTPEQEAIWRALLESNQHVIVRAGAGCLAGSTMVGLNRAGRSAPYRIDTLVHKFNGGKGRKGDVRAWDLNIPTRIRSVHDETVVLQTIEAAISSGVKQVFHLETKSGKSIKATEDHQFLTHDGWKPLGDLRDRDFLMGDVGKGGNGLAPKAAYQRMTGLVYHPFHHKSKPHCAVWTHRLVVEADRNGLSLREFVWLIRQGKIEGLQFIDPQVWYVHHADENIKNNRLSNLEVVKPSEHARHHAKEGSWDHVQAHVRPDRVTSIKYSGMEETFDLTMSDGDEPNFLADGLTVHNCGKTFTITQYAFREKRARVGLVAFNKHIAMELEKRIAGQSNIKAMTYHSLGLQSIKKAFGWGVKVDDNKVWDILDKLQLPVDKKREKNARYKIKSLVSLAKQYGVEDRDNLQHIIALHQLDLNGFEELALSYTPIVLGECAKEHRVVDFDDMVWMPQYLKLPVPKYDVLCVDEFQDTNIVQQYLALNAATRLCAVGDPAQSCYFFRGADSKAFERLRSKLEPDVIELPLMLTRRCPKSHVRLANRIVPDLVAMEDAGEGVIRELPGIPVKSMQVGDLVLCRVNAELVSAAYQLLKSGVKAVIKGKDIGKGMIHLLERGALRNPDDPLRAAFEITREDELKFRSIPGGRGEARALSARDRFECLMSLSESSSTVQQLTVTIERLFADFDEDGKPKQAVVLSTVHRAKGLEADRVFVLRPDLLPHPMARSKEDRVQEMNILYVAVTRAKKELVFCGGMPQVLSQALNTATDVENLDDC